MKKLTILIIIIIIILFSLFSFYLGRLNKQTGFITAPIKQENEPSNSIEVNNLRVCSSTIECPNGGDPVAIDSEHISKYTCVSGQCQKGSSITVECTNTAECIQKHGSGSVCDLSNNNFGKCIKSTRPDFCGDGVCQSLDGENSNTCFEDCN